MELFPIITNVLLALGGIFLIVLIISFLISRFRKEKEVITETYPAQQYQYFAGSDSNIAQSNLINEYYLPENQPVSNVYLTQIRNEQFQNNYNDQYEQEQIDNFEEPVSYINDWVDGDDEIAFENPLRKTSSFNFGYKNESNELFGGRMQIINAEPNYKFGWE